MTDETYQVTSDNGIVERYNLTQAIKCAVMLASLNIQDQVADLSPKVTSSALPGPGGATTAATNNISKVSSTNFLIRVFTLFMTVFWTISVSGI